MCTCVPARDGFELVKCFTIHVYAKHSVIDVMSSARLYIYEMQGRDLDCTMCGKKYLAILAIM